MTPTIDDLSERGLERFEEDYAARPGRESDGKKHQDRESVAYGWMMAMLRIRQSQNFTDDAWARLTGVA